MTADATSRLSSALAERYRIERELGQGGMATVYLAHDVRHKRRVALKVLRPELAAVIGAERFLHEITTTANLQHPHILPLHDSGEVDGTVFYVMPFVDGESLRERLAREKQLPVDDALRIAREVASALDYAHRQRVIHRDIKPENILLHEGQALVADFGIALAASRTEGGARLTETGMSLGTPHYMSPEQAMGERSLDARTDVYALGCVVYEMLTGEPPFTGATAQAIVSRVLTASPVPIRETRKTIPPHVEAAVLTALEKLPADRFASAADFARALGDSGYRSTVVTAASGRPGASDHAAYRRYGPWAVAGVAVVAAVLLALRPRAEPLAARGPVVATLDLTGVGLNGHGNQNFAISPDGRHVALAVTRPGGIGLAIRSLDSLGVRYLARTRGAVLPFWSPDSRQIGFFADDSIRTIDVATGTVRSLCSAPRSRGGAWGKDGTILFATPRSPLQRTTPTGGCSAAMASGPRPGRAMRPYFFPDGRHYIATTDLQVWLGELGSDSLVPLTDVVRAEAVFAPPDFLLTRQSSTGVLQARRVDVRRKRLVGEPIPVLDAVRNPGGHTSVSVSETGVLVTAELRDSRAEEDGSTVSADSGSLMLIDRGGAVVARRGPPQHTWEGIRVSRDGRRFAMAGWHIKVGEASGTARDTRVAGSVESGQETSLTPVWAPSDTAIVYQRNYENGGKIETVDLRSGAVRTLFIPPTGTRQLRLTDWSRDGQRIAYVWIGRDSTARWRALEWDARTDSTRRIVEASGHVTDLRYAPSGALIAYEVSSSGESDVFVRGYDASGAPVRVSSGGGRSPRWRGDGAELYYVAPDGSVVAVSVRYAPTLEIGRPEIVVPASALGERRLEELDVSQDGRRFYMDTGERTDALTLILDWRAMLSRAR